MKMVKRFSALAVAFLLLTCFAVSAMATNANLYYVTDTAGVFTESEKAELEQRAEAISEKYQVGVYIIVLEDFKKYANANQVWDATREIYDNENLGWGEDNAGAVMLLSMAERDYALDFYSSRAQKAFTEAGQDRLEDRVLGYFRNNNYYGGFKEYLNVCDEYLEAAAQGHPIGEGERSSADEKDGIGFLAVLPGIIAAALTGVIMSSSMHTAKEQHDADVYAVEGSLNIRRRSDMFLHRTVTRTPRESSSGSSHGSSHSSGGHSGRSGKF